jgi:L-fuculose-phosphate aldolase
VLERERERVAAASRRLAREGLVLGTAGNVSERHGDLVAITPTGCTLEHVTAEQVTVIDLDADVEAATENTLLLEWASTIYWRVAALGSPRLLGGRAWNHGYMDGVSSGQRAAAEAIAEL